MTEPTKVTGRRYRAVIISIIIAALGYTAFSLWAGWEEVSKAFVEVGITGIVIVVVLVLINYLLRFIRWQKYLAIFGHKLPFWDHLRIYLAGFALTTTPGKAGEALRSFLLEPYGVPFKHSLAAFLSERLADLIAILLLSFIGLSQYPAAHPLIVVSVFLIIIALLALSNSKLLNKLLAKLAKRRGKFVNLLSQLCHILLEAQQCHKLNVIVTATILSILAWGAEAVAFYFILQWMGAEVSLSFAIFIYALSMLAGALSFMPGGLGGAEAVMIALLILKGMTSAEAVAATLLIRFATLWFAVGLGISVLLIKISKPNG